MFSPIEIFAFDEFEGDINGHQNAISSLIRYYVFLLPSVAYLFLLYVGKWESFVIVGDLPLVEHPEFLTISPLNRVFDRYPCLYLRASKSKCSSKQLPTQLFNTTACYELMAKIIATCTNNNFYRLEPLYICLCLGHITSLPRLSRMYNCCLFGKPTVRLLLKRSFYTFQPCTLNTTHI
jgi:hypothetical protein